jgi:hypothetical protein
MGGKERFMRDKEKFLELRKVLQHVQWGSCDGCGRMWYCPICGASKEHWDDDGNHAEGEHAEDCPIGNALKL